MSTVILKYFNQRLILRSVNINTENILLDVGRRRVVSESSS